MGCQGDPKWQAEKYQHRQLKQAGSSPGKGRKHVRHQGNQKKYELFHQLAVNPVRGVIIMNGRALAACE